MRAHDIRDTMSRPPQWVEDGGETAFWIPEKFGGGMLWIGRWTGESPWERHADSEELVHQIEGEVEIVVLTDEGEQRIAMKPGSVFVVPKGCWHKQSARGRVIQVGVTPGRTEHSSAADPRREA